MNNHAVIAAAVALLSAAGFAQTPTFRTETTAVQLPVRVLDSMGSFVKDLTAADIEVLEDGVPQTVSQFTLVDMSSAVAPSPLDIPSSGVLTPAQLEKVPGRLYIFLLDDAHVGMTHSARARQLIKDFIRDRLTVADAAAVVIASGAARQDFTRDKAALSITICSHMRRRTASPTASTGARRSTSSAPASRPSIGRVTSRGASKTSAGSRAERFFLRL